MPVAESGFGHVGPVAVGGEQKLLAVHDQLRDGANPELYGGWMLVLDEDGSLIASSNAEPDPALISAAVSARDAGATTVGSERYRLYRQVSPYNGWRYVALMNEGRITASAVSARRNNWAA